MKLDPEERIIGAALDQAEHDDPNGRGAGARIEFKREGHAKVTLTISREQHCEQTGRSSQAGTVVSAFFLVSPLTRARVTAEDQRS